MAGNTDLMMYLLEKGAPTPTIERLMNKMGSKTSGSPLVSANKSGYRGNMKELNPQPARPQMYSPLGGQMKRPR